MKRGIKKSIYDFSIETKQPHVIEEYADDIDIKTVGFDSVIPVKWICSNRHELVESPHDRLRRKGAFCPLCGKHRKGTLAQIDPEMAKLYATTNPLVAEAIPCDGSTLADWRCEYGHTWRRTVVNQLKIRTCPVCSKRLPSVQYSLFALHPELELEWDADANEGIDKTLVMPNTNKKFGWICEKGHKYQCTAADRHRNKGCPYCAGKKVALEESIATTHRAIVEKYWDYTKNTYLPTELPSTSKRKIWIIDGEESKLMTIVDFIKLYG